MCEMYEIIESLCTAQGIKPGKMCAALGISRGVIGDLKAGRTKKLSAENLEKISGYFGVSVGYLLGTEENEKAPTGSSERSVSDDDLKFALWGDCDEIDDDDLADVKKYAAFVRERKKKK